MISIAEMPNTEQGLREYIRYAAREIRSFKRREKNLLESIKYCNDQLTIKGLLPEEGV